MLIADDHALVREGMRTMLAREPDLEVIGEAENGREAVEFCHRLCPDLVLMDIKMPQMDGLEATRAIKKECPTTSILIVTNYESLDYLLEAIRVGAAGYVLKDATKQQLMSAVQRVLHGESPLDQELAMRLLRRLAGETAKKERRQAPPESLTEPLTPQELRTLRLLAVGKTNRQIAQDLLVSLTTAKAYVHRVINKLRVSDRIQAAVRASELGLLRGDEHEGK